jgi:hypothetical protein
MLINEGFGGNAPDPSPFWGVFAGTLAWPWAAGFALPKPYPGFIAEWSIRGNRLNQALSCIRTVTALAAVAMAVAGCAAANNATSSQAQGEQPYKTMYGMSSDGPTTDLYTELFGPRQAAPAPATNVASAQPVQTVTSEPMAPVQQAAPPARAGQATTAPPPPYRSNQAQTSATNRAPQPAYAPPPAPPVQVAQQPAPAPAPPPEPDVPTAYGITANGPTTDLYTMIFGSKRDGQ